MPTVLSGGRGLKGPFTVKAFEIADELIVSDTRNTQIRVHFQVVEERPSAEPPVVSMGVDMEDMDEAWDILQACCPVLTRTQLEGADEAKLRQLIKGNLVTEPMLAYVAGSFIQSWVALPGKHRGKFKDLFLTREGEGERRCGISIRDDDGYESFWTMPWGSAVRCEVGATADKDLIEVFSSKAVWGALISLGFDMDTFMEKLRSADMLYTSVGLDGEIPGLFADHKNITPEVAQHLRDSEEQYIEWFVEDNPKYGVGPKRGDYAKVTLTPVVVDESEFDQELKLFLTRWDNLTGMVFEDQDLRFVSAGVVTGQGLELAKKTMLPVIAVYPDAVKLKKADGSPSIKLPPSHTTWNLNGVVAMSEFASKLMKESTLIDIINDQAQLLAWTNLEVDILQTDLAYVEEEEEGVEL